MQALEDVITRAKQQLQFGRTIEEISIDMLGQGMNETLVNWALRAAKFEIDQEAKRNGTG